jgi:hypothetical protein
MKEDPIQYAKNKLIKSLDGVTEIREDQDLKGIVKIFNFKMDNIKHLIAEYFSDELQNDETPMGAMKRNQIRKELLEFASK